MKLSKIREKLTNISSCTVEQSSCTVEQLQDGTFKACYHFVTKENQHRLIKIITRKYKSIDEDIELTSSQYHYSKEYSIYKFYKIRTFKDSTLNYINLYLI